MRDSELITRLAEIAADLNELVAELMGEDIEDVTSFPTVKDSCVYRYWQPGDRRTLVYIGSGVGDRPWAYHENTIASGFESDVEIEVVADGLTPQEALNLEYGLMQARRSLPKYNIIDTEPGVTPSIGMEGPYIVCFTKDNEVVAETKPAKTDVKAVEALWSTAYANKTRYGKPYIAGIRAGVDYDSVRIRKVT